MSVPSAKTVVTQLIEDAPLITTEDDNTIEVVISGETDEPAVVDVVLKPGVDKDALKRDIQNIVHDGLMAHPSVQDITILR